MLRDFVYSLDATALFELLGQFSVDVPLDPGGIALTRFQVITPDSFIWRLTIADGVFYLYAEDYVSGLDQISQTFDAYLGGGMWSFVPVKKRLNPDEADPIANASIYKKTEDIEVMMEYAGQSGYDFLFLARSKEDPEGALFLDAVP